MALALCFLDGGNVIRPPLASAYAAGWLLARLARVMSLDHCFSTFSVKQNPLQQF